MCLGEDWAPLARRDGEEHRGYFEEEQHSQQWSEPAKWMSYSSGDPKLGSRTPDATARQRAPRKTGGKDTDQPRPVKPSERKSPPIAGYLQREVAVQHEASGGEP